MIGRVMRRAVGRLVLAALHRGTLLIITFVVALGVVGSLLFTSGRVALPNPAGTVGGGNASNGPAEAQRANGEPDATYNYLRGNQTFDAKLMWTAYSDRFTRSLQQSGVTMDSLQAQLDQSRQRGRQVLKTQYIGSYPIANGSSMHFYVVTETAFTRGPVQYVPYTFTLDSSGKIVRTE
ncbi:MAG: hypothetical protein QOF51_2538 [Chloroflexota bacterium]|nr:hypothetical protein [Chloroflexota bacterium]